MSSEIPLKKLGEVCDFQNGFAFKSKTFKESGVPVIRISDIQDQRIDTSKIVYVKPEDYKKNLARYEIIKGDLLIAMSGATTGKIGFVEEDQKFLLNQRVGKFEPKENLDKNYLFYYLSTKVEESLAISAGSAQPNLSTKQIKGFEIPIPPLPEQKRIVAILDEAFEAIDKAKANVERNIENAEELFQSKLNEIFSQTGEGWSVKKLGKTCEISMGQSPKGSTYNDKGIGTPLINGPVEFGPKPFSETIMSKWTTDPKKMCKKGDLILCVRGSTTGRINIAGFDACIGRGVASIRYEKNQKWLNFFIRANQDYIYSLGSGSTFPNVSGKILKKIDFPEPPIEVQNNLIEVMEGMVKNTNQVLIVYRTKLQNVEELKKSILQRAFTGELTANETVAV